jgi:hypothetical protein
LWFRLDKLDRYCMGVTKIVSSLGKPIDRSLMTLIQVRCRLNRDWQVHLAHPRQHIYRQFTKRAMWSGTLVHFIDKIMNLSMTLRQI